MRTRKAGDFSVVPLGPAANLYCRHLDRFKTDVFKVFFETPLHDPARATVVALIPTILRRGCRRFPDHRSLARHLEELYGASLGAGVAKVGERHVISFRLEVLSEKYSRRRDRLRERALRLFRDLITDPVVERGAFPDAVFRQEVANHARQLRSRINEKAQYAAERHTEEMFQGEPYAIYEHGRLEDLERISPDEAFTIYRELIETAPLRVFAVGDLDAESVAPLVTRTFANLIGSPRRGMIEFAPVVRPPARRPRTVIESMDVTQGKLVLGYRTDITVHDPRYMGLLFANALLGSGPYSKLFRNVREKAQLAYYAHSGLDRIKGVLTVHCGIAFGNFDKAVRIVRKQVDNLKAGRFSDEEMKQTRLSLTRAVRSSEDSAGQKIDGCAASLVAGRVFSTKETLTLLEGVTPADVRRAAENLRLDTIYFLNGNPSDAPTAAPSPSATASRARRVSPRRRGGPT